VEELFRLRMDFDHYYKNMYMVVYKTLYLFIFKKQKTIILKIETNEFKYDKVYLFSLNKLKEESN
jgi:hypothetical protein